jgi:hypothetical protein
MTNLPEPEEIFFDDYPNFTPHYSPITMLRLGVFSGTYFNCEEPSAEEGWKNLTKAIHKDSPFWKDLNKAFPKPSDFKVLGQYPADPKSNFFKVPAGSSQEVWEAKGWIHPDDPRGWFEWYIKFYYGRRHEDDARQIKRWKDFITRHWGMLNRLTINLMTMGPASVVDRTPLLEMPIKASPTTCQNLLHWAWDYRIKPKK